MYIIVYILLPKLYIIKFLFSHKKEIFGAQLSHRKILSYINKQRLVYTYIHLVLNG